MAQIILNYIPQDALAIVTNWFNQYNFHLRITKSRATKLGDFRPSLDHKPHRISVNGDLNPYHFLITLTHEVAHLVTWLKYKNRVLPHGIEWKNTYVELINELLMQVYFPIQLKEVLLRHINNPKASTCSDPKLYKALKQFDLDNTRQFLEELEEGSIFKLRKNRVFKKGVKRRSRFECVEIKSNKKYLIQGHAEVIKLGD